MNNDLIANNIIKNFRKLKLSFENFKLRLFGRDLCYFTNAQGFLTSLDCLFDIVLKLNIRNEINSQQYNLLEDIHVFEIWNEIFKNVENLIEINWNKHLSSFQNNLEAF